MKMARGCWNNFPYYTGPCADTDGCYGYEQEEDNCDNGNDNNNCDNTCCCPRCRRRRCHKKCCFGGGGGMCCDMFSAWLPMALSPNGIVPLVMNKPCRGSDFNINSGMITLEKGGTYLATYTVKAPETAALDTTISLNVDGASQSTASTQVITEAGTTTSSFTGQAIFEADEGATVSLRTSEAINVTDPATQPMFTLSLVQLSE